MAADKGVNLAQATNALNEALRAAERHLTALELGVTVNVGLALWGIPEVQLGFGKIEQRWTLYVLYRNGTTEPAINASRRIRIAVADAVPTLERRLREQVKTETDKVTEAMENLTAYLDTRRNG